MVDPIAWQGVSEGVGVGLTSNPKIAQLWRETGRTVTALVPETAPAPIGIPGAETMVPMRDEVVAAIRKGLTDNLRDLTSLETFDVDVLLRGCQHAMHLRGYEHPEDAAEILAGAAASAVMALYSAPTSGAEKGEAVAWRVYDASQQSWSFTTVEPSAPSPASLSKVEPLYAAPISMCQRCQGNGEIVTNWDKYNFPDPASAGAEDADHGVEECLDCDGTSHAPAPTSERVQALEPELLRGALQAEWDEIQKLPLATGDRHEWDLARRARIRDALNHKSS